MDIRNKKILIYGMGISGKGLAQLLRRAGISMALHDNRKDLDVPALLDELQLDKDTKVVLGDLKKEDLDDIDIVAISPGISAFAPEVELARSAGKQITGELELAYELSKGMLIAITGTNGKTTTTSLTGEIMKAYFNEVFVVGNIGFSYASKSLDTTENSVTVAEISSFQLETISQFHPEISAVLNLTPDHLDRHKTFENYALCKMSIASNQTADEKCIINYDDEYLRELSKDLTPEVVYFSRREKLEKGVYLDGDMIVYSDGMVKKELLNKNDTNLMGDHNVENVMAAAAISICAGVPEDIIVKVIKEFKAVEHRIEFVRTLNGVSYYNDSKGTNTDAAARAVESMVCPTVLIAGGYDKGADFSDWIKGFNGKVKEMILIGATADKIALTARENGFDNIYMAGELDKAVERAVCAAEPGDCVLLSPACASWDQFNNYEQRGRIFKDLVNSL